MTPLEALTVADAHNLPGPARNVLVVFAVRAGNGTGESFPSIARLARDTGHRRTTIMRAIAHLETLGMVIVTRRHGRANRYQLSPTSSPERHPSRRRPVAQSDQVVAQRDHTSSPERHELLTNSGIELGARASEPEPPPYVRCPNRTGWKICEPDCPLCHGTGHIPHEAVS